MSCLEGGPEGHHPEFVRIPECVFLMGGDAEFDHRPVHEVELRAFRLTRFQITNTQYELFCRETSYRLPEFWERDGFNCGPEFPRHPVIGVSWQDAQAFSAWAGGRLPTEAEWEYAARGGLFGKPYPFGEEADPTLANYAGTGTTGTVPVGTFAPNGFGLFDMSGNVVEWVADRYDSSFYSRSPRVDPQGPAEAKHRVIRGGGWHSGPYCIRVDFRNALPANWVDFNVGFRVAASIDA